MISRLGTQSAGELEVSGERPRRLQYASPKTVEG